MWCELTQAAARLAVEMNVSTQLPKEVEMIRHMCYWAATLGAAIAGGFYRDHSVRVYDQQRDLGRVLGGERRRAPVAGRYRPPVLGGLSMTDLLDRIAVLCKPLSGARWTPRNRSDAVRRSSSPSRSANSR
jgi:hypothetical protein